MKALKSLAAVIVVFLLTSVESFRILGIFSHFGKSHFDVFRPLLVALAERGHDVTVIGFFPLERKTSRYNDVTIPFPGNFTEVIHMEGLSGTRLEKYWNAAVLWNFAKVTCELGLSSEQYRKTLHSNKTFDIILSEFFNSNCWLLPFATKFNVPIIGITSHILMPWTNDWIGNPDHPAYVPSIFMDYSDQLSFIERTENSILNIAFDLFYKFVIERGEKELFKKHLSADFSTDILYNTSIVLSNSHFTLTRPRPLVPNVVEICGIHIGTMKKLPPNLEKWISESTHGVIYFSLGSMIKGHTFPEDKRQMFLNAFRRLPQRVLWKWETEEMPGKPNNIMLQKWMPQFDILSHPNVKAFISHGGLLGTTEAVHCGVPMVIMPQYGDQFANAKAVEASGGGVVLDFRTLTEEKIYNALQTVLNASFLKQAKELSARFRDRPLPPLDTAVYWVEYVARHGGAPHMRTAAVGMPFYQYLLLDVTAFLSVMIFIILYVNYRFTKFVFRKMFRKGDEKKIKKS